MSYCRKRQILSSPHISSPSPVTSFPIVSTTITSPFRYEFRCICVLITRLPFRIVWRERRRCFLFEKVDRKWAEVAIESVPILFVEGWLSVVAARSVVTWRWSIRQPRTAPMRRRHLLCSYVHKLQLKTRPSCTLRTITTYSSRTFI